VKPAHVGSYIFSFFFFLASVPDDVIPDKMTMTTSEIFLLVKKKITTKAKNKQFRPGARRAAYGVCLGPLACWDCGFESCLGH